jgi:broad specificity phosphatase PhoE
VKKEHFTRFILVRHGQTGWNKDERFRGRADIALDETGLEQARLAAERIGEWEISAVYSSPLKRASRTAQCIADRFGLSVVTLEGLNDMNFGQWEGLLVSEVREKHAKLFNEWRHNPERFAVPGGESLGDVRRRVIKTVDELALKHEGQDIAVVSHRVVCKVLLCHLLGLDNSHFWKIAQDSTAVNAFEIYEMIGTGEKRSTVTLVNDTCHLKEL